MENENISPELGWSLYISGGWKSQFERVQRWYKRAKNANNPIDRLDFLYAFYENAFHLRDWLINTNSLSKKKLGRLFSVNESMRLCRDLANSHKHYSIEHPSQPVPPSELREYSIDHGNLDSKNSLIVISNGKKMDAFSLAEQILQTWEEFIRENLK